MSKHHLCVKHQGSGEICTNRCPERSSCTTQKIPFLIEALDILVSEIETGELDGIFYTSFKSYCIAPESYINELAFMQNPEIEHPSITSAHCEYCDRSFLLTADQKETLKTDNFTKYFKANYLYCSAECRDKHLRKLSTSKSASTGSLKNHEYALVINGADVTKRQKEDKVQIVTGTITEQRARCLFEKLVSTLPRGKRKYLTSNEVQNFLLKDLPANLKVQNPRKGAAAYDIMIKTKELYLNMISIGWINKKSRYIEYII